MPWRANLDPTQVSLPSRKDGPPPVLTPEEISDFCHSLAAARDQFGHGVKSITAQYGLGPRGPWIIGIVGRMSVSPHQLADFFSVGRSLITAELVKLAEGGLIEQVKDQLDGRRSTIKLTVRGKQAYAHLQEELNAFLAERLTGYTPEEIRLCAQLLADFSKTSRP